MLFVDNRARETKWMCYDFLENSTRGVGSFPCFSVHDDGLHGWHCGGLCERNKPCKLLAYNHVKYLGDEASADQPDGLQPGGSSEILASITPVDVAEVIEARIATKEVSSQ